MYTILLYDVAPIKCHAIDHRHVPHNPFPFSGISNCTLLLPTTRGITYNLESATACGGHYIDMPGDNTIRVKPLPIPPSGTFSHNTIPLWYTLARSLCFSFAAAAVGAFYFFIFILFSEITFHDSLVLFCFVALLLLLLRRCKRRAQFLFSRLRHVCQWNLHAPTTGGLKEREKKWIIVFFLLLLLFLKIAWGE